MYVRYRKPPGQAESPGISIYSVRAGDSPSSSETGYYPQKNETPGMSRVGRKGQRFIWRDPGCSRTMGGHHTTKSLTSWN